MYLYTLTLGSKKYEWKELIHSKKEKEKKKKDYNNIDLF